MGDPLRIIFRCDLTPIVGRRICFAIAAMRERQEKPVRRAVFSIATPPTSGDANEAERFGLTNGWRDGGMVYAVLHEIVRRDRQLSVIVAAVVTKLDLDARNNEVGGTGQRPVCWRLKHLD
jgi:hypothetical protein